VIPTLARLRRQEWHWRWIAGIGLLAGAGVGLFAALRLEHPLWALAWLAACGGLIVAGWDVRLRQLGELPVPRSAGGGQVRVVADGPFHMAELPGGTFWMGSADDDAMAGKDEKPRHPVTLSPFRIACTTVTRGQWQSVMQDRALSETDAELPVTKVSWDEALRFCNAASQRQGYKPCYRLTGIGKWRGWRCDWSADGYRLPTEAEWEYACRAGTDTRWCFGDDPVDLADYAWFAENSEGHAHPVAQKEPNRWGLYDLHGNVWEWCWDRYGSYNPRPSANRRGPRIGGPRRVLRGGSFGDAPVYLRSAFRGADVPLFRLVFIGFRCVRVPARQH